MLRMARKNWSAITAHAFADQPHAIQRTLLPRKSQKPHLRRASAVEPVSQAAMTVTTIAGHWRWMSHGMAGGSAGLMPP